MVAFLEKPTECEGFEQIVDFLSAHMIREPKRKKTQVPQPSGSIKHVADEAVHKERGEILVRAATTASSLEAEHDNGNIDKTQSKTPPNKASSPGTTSGGGPRSVKKLEKKQRSRTHKLKRLYKVGLTARVDSSEDEQNLGEDASKQERIEAIDADEDITLVNDQDDAKMFDVNDLQGEEVFVEKEVADKEVNDEVQKVIEEVVKDINTAKLIVDVAQVNAAELKTTKPKAKEIVLQEPSESPTTTTIPKKKSQDKGKAILIEEPMKLKKKDRIRLDEATALKLQAKFDEEEQRLAREKERELKRNRSQHCFD
nr:hypothetical protein [Tanacetum cinerariifolium]